MNRLRRWGPGLLLMAPSLGAIALFVYGFVGWNIQVSLSGWQGMLATYDVEGFDAYGRLADDDRFLNDVRNVVIFTALFVGGTLVVGFLLALLLERGVRAEAVFRTIFLAPMAVSLIAVAIIWRWLMNNATGAQETGFNKLFGYLGLDFLKNDWFKSNTDWAVASIGLAAGWALSGYIMALFLAGMRGVPEDLREAARVDGANEARAFWHVVRPMLVPVTMSAVVILFHISLKTFDLIYAMDPKSLRIETPAVYMWFTTFEGLNFNTGAAIATLLFIGVSLVIVPYIWHTMRSERRR